MNPVDQPQVPISAPLPQPEAFEPPKPKLKLPVLVSIIIFLTIIGSASAYLFLNSSNKEKACSMEAKICPDGSSVDRTGPKCEFASCPTPKSTIDPTANWKTYSSQVQNFEFKHPTEYLISKENPKQVVLGIDNNNGFIEDILFISSDQSTFVNASLYKTCADSGSIPDYPCTAEWKVDRQTLGGKQAKVFQFASAQDGGFVIVQTMEDPKVELKMFIAGGGLEYTFGQILSTFKFTQ